MGRWGICEEVNCLGVGGFSSRAGRDRIRTLWDIVGCLSGRARWSFKAVSVGNEHTPSAIKQIFSEI